MGNKNRIFLTVFVFSILTSYIFSKDRKDDSFVSEENFIASRDYYIQDTQDGSVFVQTLKWNAEEGASAYRVHLEQRKEAENDEKERNSDSSWEEIKTETVETNQLEVALCAGAYRYRIEVINFLDQVETVSAYQYVTILKAYQPAIKSVNIKHIYLDEENDGVFLLRGENFLETTVFLFTPANDTTKGYKGKILERAANGKSIKVRFDLKRINPGTYTVTATDVSGLKSVSEDVVIKYKKPMDLDFYGGYCCSYMPGSSVLTDYFQTSFLPLGGRAGITFIPVKTGIGYFGVGIFSMFFPMEYSQTGYTLSANLITGTGCLVYQKPIIKHKLHWEAYVGGGIIYLNNMEVVYLTGAESPKEETIGISLSAGTKLQWYVLKRMYIEAGLDYTYSFHDDLPHNNLYPVFCIGGQL